MQQKHAKTPQKKKKNSEENTLKIANQTWNPLKTVVFRITNSRFPPNMYNSKEIHSGKLT